MLEHGQLTLPTEPLPIPFSRIDEVRTEAHLDFRGSSTKTFINGVPAADLTDDLTKEGVIALQVHGIGNKTEAVGKEVRWRNIRIRELK